MATEKNDPSLIFGFKDGDKNNFDKIESSVGINFVLFWRKGCGSCEYLAPILEKMAKGFGHGVSFWQVEVTEDDVEFKERHGIEGFPTANVYHNGTYYQQIVGYRYEPYYMADFSKILQTIADKTNTPRVFHNATGGLLGNAV